MMVSKQPRPFLLTSSRARVRWLAVLAGVAFGLLLMFAPSAYTDRLRSGLRDVARPGLVTMQKGRVWGTTVWRDWRTVASRWSQQVTVPTPPDPTFVERMHELERQCHVLRTANAELRERLNEVQSGHVSPLLGEEGPPLFIPEVLSASVIAADEVARVSERLVDRGESSGLLPFDLVIRDAGALVVDQGADAGVHPDQPVFAGRSVLGRIQHVGWWTSSVLPITDVEYRGSAQLLRISEQGARRGAEGVVAGDGRGRCRLTLIPASEAVSIGDEVYTSPKGQTVNVPMYYGRVVAAELPAGAPHWEITVDPGGTWDDVRTVQVLRSVVNPARMAAIDSEGSER